MTVTVRLIIGVVLGVLGLAMMAGLLPGIANLRGNIPTDNKKPFVRMTGAGLFLFGLGVFLFAFIKILPMLIVFAVVAIIVIIAATVIYSKQPSGK